MKRICKITEHENVKALVDQTTDAIKRVRERATEFLRAAFKEEQRLDFECQRLIAEVLGVDASVLAIEGRLGCKGG